MNRMFKLDAPTQSNQQAFAIDSGNPQDESRFLFFWKLERSRTAQMNDTI